MTLEELIKKLKNMVETDPELAEAEVHMVTQPHYPLVTQLSHVKLQSKNAEEIADAKKELCDMIDQSSRAEVQEYIDQLERDEEHTIVMVEGSWVDYGSRSLWNDEN